MGRNVSDKATRTPCARISRLGGFLTIALCCDYTARPGDLTNSHRPARRNWLAIKEQVVTAVVCGNVCAPRRDPAVAVRALQVCP